MRFFPRELCGLVSMAQIGSFRVDKMRVRFFPKNNRYGVWSIGPAPSELRSAKLGGFQGDFQGYLGSWLPSCSLAFLAFWWVKGGGSSQ